MPIFIVLFLTLSLESFAGLVVSGTITQAGQQSPLKQFYEGKNARLEFRSAPAQDHWLLYRGGNGTINVVDFSRKSYMEFNEADVQRLGPILSVFPPGGAPPPVKPVVPKDVSLIKENGIQTVGKWKCIRYSVQSQGKKVGSLCVVSFDKIGAKAGDFKPLSAIARSFSSLGNLAPQQASFLGWSVDESLKLGFAVEAVGVDPSGKETSRMVVENIIRQPLADGVFAAPKGFARNDLTNILQGIFTGKASRK